MVGAMDAVVGIQNGDAAAKRAAKQAQEMHEEHKAFTTPSASTSSIRSNGSRAKHPVASSTVSTTKAKACQLALPSA